MSRLHGWKLAVFLALALLGLMRADQAAAAPNAVLIGKVTLQGRATYADTLVYYDGVLSGRTIASGDFALAVGNGGFHILRVKQPGYLSREMMIENPTGFVHLAETRLRMGDVNGDDAVNFADLYLLTLAFNTSPPSDPRADLNADGRVDAADLAGMMANYNLIGPLPWQDPAPPPSGLLWTGRASLPTARFNVSVAELGGRVYAVGGEDDIPLGRVEVYDPLLDTWQPRASLPTPRTGLAVVALGGKLYAIGGNGADGRRLDTVEVYDPATDRWTSAAPMPTRRGDLAAVTLNGKIYAVGGASGGSLTTLEVYDPATNTWTSKAPMPTRRAYLGAVAAPGGKLLAIGGYDLQALDAVEAYDPATDSWLSLAPMPTPRFALAVAPLAGQILAVGGWETIALSTAEVYDPLANTWQERTPMPSARANVAAAALGDRVLVVGGWNGRPLATVEQVAVSSIVGPD